jgi:hypothetical protein
VTRAAARSGRAPDLGSACATSRRRPKRYTLLVAALAVGAGAGPAVAEPAGGRQAESIQRELERLRGHRVEVAPDGRSYRILDIAGEGAPLVGVVERRGAGLWLRGEDGLDRRLTGPLAIPRIAGPGYKVWVIGSVNQSGQLSARRIGVLAPPPRRDRWPP